MADNKEYFLKYLLKPLLVSALLILVDQATKYAVRNAFYPGEIRPIMPFFQLTYLTNTGIAFSMFQGANIVFALFTAVMIIALAAWYTKNAPQLDGLAKTALVLVASGGTGNLIDRLVFGRVTDFLDLYAGNYHWPSFNAADSCISIGGTLLFIWLVKPAQGDKKGSGSNNAADNN